MLSQRQWAQIHANQREEIERLITDRVGTERQALLPDYACLGKWLAPCGSGRVLELGCGPGRFVAMLAQLGYDVVGVDPCGYDSFPTWELLGKLPRVELRGGIRAEALPFSDGTFNHVCCLGALLYFDDPGKALSEIWRVMKPGGRLVVRTVNRDNLYTAATGRKLDPASKNLYTRDELVALVQEHGFRVAESFSYGFWPPAFTQYWWYLVNTIVTPPIQRLLSKITPARRRVNVTVFATHG
jgi:SAM-dependent methyltransferase